jgi:hypothetical protein
MTLSGQLILEECPNPICVSALAEVSKILPAISERLVNKSDPNFQRFNIVHCTDVGLNKGG